MLSLYADAGRSIPACAGEPTRPFPTMPPRPVYPRVCGGTCGGQLAHGGRSGLSPRVRGNRPSPTPTTPMPGSIPACAGEPSGFLPGGAADRVYPRVCGGTTGIGTTCTARGGLSPRVRGNHRWYPRCESRPRSIPACAGEPCTLCQPTLTGKVYPRVCGGTARQRQRGQAHKGLSPRVRGNPDTPPPPTMACRSIPACAGEP